jgi:hypothetical protein
MRNQILSAINATAPVVGISIENDEPFAVDGKRLRAWAKGVTIITWKVEYAGGEWYPVFTKPQGHNVQGPANFSVEQSDIVRRLRITGLTKSAKCSCLMNPVTRYDARMKLRKWADAEAERIAKRKVALSKEDRKSLKLALFETEGESIPVMCRLSGAPGKTLLTGIPISIPDFPLLSFAIVKWGDGQYRVTELISGTKCGESARTAEAALLSARLAASKLSHVVRATITANCFAQQLENPA